MEAWERVLEEWKGNTDVGSFTHFALAADAVLKEDLADFEIEWVSWSLLYEPVHLLELIKSHAGDSTWTKPLTDAFKLITTLVERYPECSDQYHDDIVMVCQSGVCARARAAALQCVCARAARCVRGVPVRGYIVELEAPHAYKAPLAHLLGVVCERHPEAVAEEVGRVWRALLNLLDASNNTDAVRKAALRGAGGVLARFGDELPVAEVALLYPSLTADLDAVSLELLERHAMLFRERAAADVALRRRLWAGAGGGEPAARAALAVTLAAVHVCDLPALQSILEREILPLTSHAVPRVRFGALQVACEARARRGAAACRDVTHAVDVHALEFQLRTDIDNVAEDVARAVCWCVEWRVPHAGVLLQTAILNYERVPGALAPRLLHAGLRAEAAAAAAGAHLDPDDSGLEFLVGESERAPLRYLPLWRAACAGSAGAPLARELARRVAARLALHADSSLAELPKPLEHLVRVCAHALADAECTSAARMLAAPLCAALRLSRALPAPVLLLLPLLSHTEHADELYRRVEVCVGADEEWSCAGAVAALHAPPAALEPDALLAAAQVVVRRRDAAPATVRRALRAAAGLPRARLHHVVSCAERRRAILAGATLDREERVLRRELDVFLGAHGEAVEGGDEEPECEELDLLLAELGDRVALPLPALDCQWSLKRVVKLALEREDQNTLALLTALICDHADMKREQPPAVLLAVLARVLAARAAGAARGEAPPPPSPDLPLLATHLVQRMCCCASGGARRVLRDVLRPLLRGAALWDAAELIAEMLAPHNAPGAVAGALEASAALVAVVRAEAGAARVLLPLLPLLAAAPAPRARYFTAAVDALLHLREVFTAQELESVARQLLSALLELDVASPGAAAACRETALAAARLLRDLAGADELAEMLLQARPAAGGAQWLLAAAALRRALPPIERAVVRAALPLLARPPADSHFHCEAVLTFVAECATTLFDEHYESATDALCGAVLALPARGAWGGGAQVALAACARALGERPPRVARALERWAAALPLRHLAERIQNLDATAADVECVCALRCVLEAWPVAHAAHALSDVSAHAHAWLTLVLRAYVQAPEEAQEQAPFLGACVCVSVYVRGGDALAALLAEDERRAGGGLARALMPHIYTLLLRRPFVLCAPQLAARCTLLRDVAACCRDRDAAPLLELADELWERCASRDEARSLVAALVRAGASESARAVRWAAGAVGDAARPLAARAALLAALPPGDLATAACASLCRDLPARAAECVGAHAHAVRATLEALSCAPAPPAPLLDLLVSLAAGEACPAWLACAMETCMASLAVRATPATLRAVHERAARHARPLLPVDRLLVPLIGSCTGAVCEQYFSGELAALLAGARPVAGAAAQRARALVHNTLTVTLLRLLFEKVPRGALESPASALHRALPAAGALRPWHAAREACKLIVTLQRKTPPPPHDAPELAPPTRVFHQRAYNALCALVCVWRADASLYSHVVGGAWDTLLGDEDYSLPLRARTFRTHRRLVAAGGGEAVGGGAGAGTLTARSSTRVPRVFLRTLSESPYSFDLFEEPEEPGERVELVVRESALNRHPCAASLSALLGHLAAAGDAAGGAWLPALCSALAAAPRNLRWLLAQCAVNVRSKLRVRAGDELSAALLRCVRDTAAPALNELHLDILGTVAQWHTGDAPAPLPPPNELVSACTCALVRACMAGAGGTIALDSLGAFLRAFPGATLDWEELRTQLDGAESEACVRVLLRAVRAGARVPQLPAALLERIPRAEPRHGGALCRLFGESARALPGEQAARAWRQFGAAAARLRATNPARYVNALHCARDTDTAHFKSVADIAMKVRAERGKCVSVLATIMLASAREERVRLREALPPELRPELAAKCPSLAFDEFFPVCEEGSPVAKRARTDRVMSRLLETRADEGSFARALAQLPPHERWDKLHELLARDEPALRFVECVYACVYLPARHPACGWRETRGVRAAALVALAVRAARTDPRHLRAAVPAPKEAYDATHAGTRTLRTRTATLRTVTSTTTSHTGSRPAAAAPAPVPASAIALDSALDTLLRFGESCWEGAAWLAAEAWRTSDAAPEHANMLADLLGDTLSAAPCALRLACDLAPHLPDVARWRGGVERALQQHARSEAGAELRLLHDELRVRTPPHLALQALGLPPDEDEVTLPHREQEFSIEALVRSFGALAEWAARPERERRAAAARLPPLWTTPDNFRRLLHRYRPDAEDEGWFARSVRVRRGARDVTRLLGAVAAWPRDRFHVAAVVEALDAAASGAPPPCDDSCLVEWAARLQLRASAEPSCSRAREHALAWVRAALARRLPRLALHCIKTVTAEHELSECEALAWAVVRARALRDAGGETGEQDAEERDALLRKALRVFECGARLVETARAHDVLELAVLELGLRADLACLTDDIVERTLDMATAACERDDPSAREGDSMRELCELAILHYDDTWDTRSAEASVARMCGVLARCVSETGAAVLLARLDPPPGRGERAVARLPDTVAPLLRQLPPALGARLRPWLPAAPRDPHDDPELDQWRRRLQLLCGAEHTLLAHCEALERALVDADEAAWRAAFSRLRAELWEDESVGAEHRALRHHRPALERLESAGLGDAAASSAALRAVAAALRAGAGRTARSVRALCPALGERSPEVRRALAAILQLPAHEVLGLDDEIPVFADSVRAPGVLAVRLTRARRRRYLLKRERLALDAAAATAIRALTPDHPPPQVILLSAECGLIEFLEGFERLGELVRAECDLAGVGFERVSRRAEELVLAPPELALRSFAQICEQVPAHALRRAFWRRAADPAHLARCVRRYTRSLADAALAGWLLGLGDRHAHNVLVSCGAGAVRDVDAGALFQRAAAAELPAARLTAQLRAPAHHPRLEAELQAALREVRARRLFVVPRLALAFAEAGNYSHEVSLMGELVEGRWLAHEVTARALRERHVPHAERYIELMQELFAHVRARNLYTVEEQVSSLLLLSTAPRVLAVTRSEWEPWL